MANHIMQLLLPLLLQLLRYYYNHHRYHFGHKRAENILVRYASSIAF